MGQAYIPVIKIEGKVIPIKREYNGWYISGKLTELACGIDRDFVNSVISCLYKKIEPCKLAFIGDYSSDDEYSWFWNMQHDFVWNWIWDEQNQKIIKPEIFNPKPFKLIETLIPGIKTNKYLVNHTTRQYLDIDKYIHNCGMVLDCLHPVVMLTAVGNGLGGGDYDTDAISADKVGIWAWDDLNIRGKIPKGYTEFTVVFNENIKQGGL